MTTKPLISLQEFNRLRVEGLKSHPDGGNGIACPKCGAEMMDTFPDSVLLSAPPQKSIACMRCPFTSTRLA